MKSGLVQFVTDAIVGDAEFFVRGQFGCRECVRYGVVEIFD